MLISLDGRWRLTVSPAGHAGPEPLQPFAMLRLGHPHSPFTLSLLGIGLHRGGHAAEPTFRLKLLHSLEDHGDREVRLDLLDALRDGGRGGGPLPLKLPVHEEYRRA